MSPELISICALLVMFVVATVLPVSMGAVALVAAVLLGTLAADLSTDDILGGVPGDLFVTLVGITYVFAIASASASSVGVLGATIPLAVWWSRAGCEPLGGTVLG